MKEGAQVRRHVGDRADAHPDRLEDLNHSPIGGLGDHLLNELSAAGLMSATVFRKFGVEGLLACGTPQEALQYHGLDGESLARRIVAESD